MYLAFQGLHAFTQRLPLRVARAIGRLLGVLAYGLLVSQRRIALSHLHRAFGESLTLSQRRAIVRRLFRNLGQNLVEWLSLPRWSAQDIQALIAGEGLEHLRQALAGGNGAIVITAHFGNWELIPVYLRSLGFEGGVLARRLRYPEYEAFMISMRGAYGVPTLARGSLQEVATLLRANQIVGMLPDQDIDSLEGVFVTFFGHPAHTPVGPAALSMMTGAPIVPCFLIREGGRFRFVVEPPLQAPQAADRSAAMAALTQAWSDVVESYIRRFPDHWVWMHRRWKTQPSITDVQGSGFRVRGSDPQPPTPNPEPTAPHLQPVLGLVLLAACGLSLLASGCGKAPRQQAASAESAADQAMSAFTLTGYKEDGSKRWVLNGQGASADGHIVTIQQPDAVGYEPGRTAVLTASTAQVNQTNRHVRLEHDVTIHTSDGLWFTSPVLHWIPDQNQMATDLPVRIETDHMLLRGRGAHGLTQLKQATIFRDIELVLNPSDHEPPDGAAKQVVITCDGPLDFDYERNVATFHQNVHVKDPSGDLYSDTLVAYLDPRTHTIRYAEATGNVRIHQHQNTAVSERAVYEPAIGKITLLGSPSLLIYPEADGPSRLPGGLAKEPKG